MTVSTPSQPASGRSVVPTTRELLADRSVVAFLVSVFLSVAALIAQTTALGKQVFDLTHRELDLGWLGLVEFVPVVLLVIPAGNVSDRLNRVRIVVVGLVVEALASGLFFVLAGRRSTTLLAILGVVLLFGTARAFSNPASRSMTGNLF